MFITSHLYYTGVWEVGFHNFHGEWELEFEQALVVLYQQLFSSPRLIYKMIWSLSFRMVAHWNRIHEGYAISIWICIWTNLEVFSFPMEISGCKIWCISCQLTKMIELMNEIMRVGFWLMQLKLCGCIIAHGSQSIAYAIFEILITSLFTLPCISSFIFSNDHLDNVCDTPLHDGFDDALTLR